MIDKASTTGEEKQSGEGASLQTDNAPDFASGGTVDAPMLRPENSPVQASSSTSQPQTLYPLRLTVDNHEHNGLSYRKGQTIALDAAEYTYAVRQGLGEPGVKENVGLDVDAQGQPIKPEAPLQVTLPTAQGISQ